MRCDDVAKYLGLGMNCVKSGPSFRTMVWGTDLDLIIPAWTLVNYTCLLRALHVNTYTS